MSELIMACAKLKTAMSNDYAIERYIIMTSPNYTHPGWVKQESKHKGAVYGRRKTSSR